MNVIRVVWSGSVLRRLVVGFVALLALVVAPNTAQADVNPPRAISLRLTEYSRHLVQLRTLDQIVWVEVIVDGLTLGRFQIFECENDVLQCQVDMDTFVPVPLDFAFPGPVLATDTSTVTISFTDFSSPNPIAEVERLRVELTIDRATGEVLDVNVPVSQAGANPITDTCVGGGSDWGVCWEVAFRYAPGFETCDGADNDADGQFDEDPGSCAARHLFVPHCWDARGRTPEAQHAELTAAMQRWEDFYHSRTGLSACGLQRPIWYEAGPLNSINVPDGIEGRADCPQTIAFEMPNPDGPGVITFRLESVTLLVSLRDSGVYNLDEWDTISFVSNPLEVVEFAGRYSGGGAVRLKTSADIVGLGEFTSFAHEWGHSIGLTEEYEIDFLQNDPPDDNEPINRLDPALGCDPGPAVNLVAENTQEFFEALGPCCAPNPDGCDITGSTPDNLCETELCNGNRGLHLDGWRAGDPDPGPYPDPNPNVEGDEGRCIMSYLNAPGFDAGSSPSGTDSQRAWCSHCWQTVKQNIPACDSLFPGGQRRISILGVVEWSGLVRVFDTVISEGRVGAPMPADGNLVVRVEKPSGELLGTFAPRAGALRFGEPVELGATEFWARIPVASDVTLPLRLTSVRDGVAVGQVTPGGGAPSVSFESVSVDCTSAAGAELALGVAAEDPDGDTLFYKWTAESVELTETISVAPTGVFPIGTTSVEVTVQDGTGLSETASGMVVVSDAAAPTFDAVEPDRICVAAPIPLPTATDACSDSVSIEGRLCKMRRPDLDRNDPSDAGIPAEDPTLRCADEPVVTNEDPSGALDKPGRYLVEWTATDTQGNTAKVYQQLDALPCNDGAELRALELRGEEPEIGQGRSEQSQGSCTLGAPQRTNAAWMSLLLALAAVRLAGRRRHIA